MTHPSRHALPSSFSNQPRHSTAFAPDNVIISRNGLCHHTGIVLSSSSAPIWFPTDVWNRNLQELHQTLPPFQPIIPVSLLPYLAFILLTLTFGLAFYFSTSVRPTDLQFMPSCLMISLYSLPKGTVRESAVATLASVLGGFGTVAMFCTVGVYV